MVRTKVFVGNLDFKTQESELAQEFATAGKVISANIITRGPRSLGYGFVELESEQDAQNAVKVMNKKKINDREINVEIARERVEGQPRPQRGPSKRFRYRYRKNFRGNNNNAERGNDSTDEPTNNAPRRRSFRRVSQDRGEQQQDQQQQQRPPRVIRPPRRPIEERNHIPSKTTLFVANLPFALDDESFGQVFKDEGLPFKSAHVVKKRNNRSKGFGFVEFDSESDQQKALNVINNKNVKGRELVVKIALTEQREREEVTNPPKEENKQEKPAEPKKEEKKPEPKKEEKKPADKDEKKPTEAKKNETKKSEPKKQETKK